MDNDSQQPTASESKESVFSTATVSSSAEKLEQEVMNDQLDYEDDLDEFDEKERRESKFESERNDSNKSKKIDELLPQQKGQKSVTNDGNNSEQFGKTRGGYRGRGRGNFRGRGGKLINCVKMIICLNFDRISSSESAWNLWYRTASIFPKWYAIQLQSRFSNDAWCSCRRGNDA